MDIEIELKTIDEFNESFEKLLAPIFRREAAKMDRFCYLKMEKVFRENSLKILSHSFNLDIAYFDKFQTENLKIGGYFINDNRKLIYTARKYGFDQYQILEKDIYFIYKLLRPIFEQINEIKYRGMAAHDPSLSSIEFNQYILPSDMVLAEEKRYVELTYHLIKKIRSRIRFLYGNISDYGLSKYLDKLYEWGIEHGADFRTQSQKRMDCIKEDAADAFGCLICTGIFVGITCIIVSILKSCN